MKVKFFFSFLVCICGAINLNAQNQVIDMQGNVYESVSIGTQIWTKTNLQTSTLQDGTPLKFVENSSEWAKTIEPAYCRISNIDSIRNIGYLYNWYAVNTGKLCPNGWHVPQDYEWTILVSYIGGELSGGKLKSSDSLVWKSPNLQATNVTNFSALPAGYRNKDGNYYNQKTHAFFWSNSPAINNTAWYRSLGYKDVIIGSTPQSKFNGLSVRCIKD